MVCERVGVYSVRDTTPQSRSTFGEYVVVLCLARDVLVR
jgi:hypothetical protein